MNNRHLNLVLCLLLVLLVFSIPLSAQDMPQPVPVGQRPDAPIYALHGPYWVGTKTIYADAASATAHRMIVWYPALNPEALPEETVYTMAVTHPVRNLIPRTSPFTVLGHAIANAPQDLSAAPYPLVIFSDAFTFPHWYTYIGEHLASYGFVVIAPEHDKDSWDNLYPSIVMRMFDVTRAIRTAEIFTAEGGILEGLIDTETIAVGGAGAGGMTSYAAAGASMNWASVEEFCRTAVEEPGCTELDRQLNDIQILLQTNAEVGQQMPTVGDNRVDAIFPISATVEMYGEQGLHEITIPMMTIYGTGLGMTPLVEPAYTNVSSTKKVEVRFDAASPNIFRNDCTAYPYLIETDLYWTCSDPIWDMPRAHDLTLHFLTAFLLDVLKGDSLAYSTLIPATVNFDGIDYRALGYLAQPS